MDRRHFLKTAASSAAALTGVGTLLGGCAPAEDTRALVMRSWVYEPDLVRLNLQRFSRFEPGVPVDYAPLSGSWHDKMVALFVARTPLDLIYVRDDHFAEWVEARWLQPIDRLPGAREYQKEIFPFNWEAMTYNGRLYGLPYYADIQIWVYNRRMLEAAGITECARTLDGIAEQCIRIREKRIEGPQGVVELPLILGLKQAPVGFSDIWALLYASEISLFTPDLEPIFPDDPGRRCERVLQWLVDAAQKHRILDLDASFSTADVRDVFGAGRQAMVSISKYDLQRLNDPGKTATAGDAVMAQYPSLEPGQAGTLGWTRMYCLPSTCRHPEESWKLMNFLGGRDPNGEYSTAKFWGLRKGIGSAFPALLNDPEIVASTNQWGEIAKIREQARSAKPRENIKAPWFAQFDAYFQAEIQEVLQARRSPRDGLARIAAECRRLRAEWA